MRGLTRDSWAALGILAAVVAVAVFVVFRPQGREIQAAQARIEGCRKALELNQERASDVPELALEIQALSQRYQGFDRRMPKRKELAGFLQEISGILASEPLRVQLTEPGRSVREKLFHRMPIVMKFQGSYLALTSLLDRIDKMERLTWVRKLNVAKVPGSEDLDVEVQMNIYFTES